MSEQLGAVFVLPTDIDCRGFDAGDGLGFKPVGTPSEPFTGELRGGGHGIIGLRVARNTLDAVGLFATTEGARIEDLRLTAVEVQGRSAVGGLVGQATNGTRIARVIVDGALVAQGLAGGIAGSLIASGIENSHASVAVTSHGLRGALLVGAVDQDSTLLTSYARGRIADTDGRLVADRAPEALVTSFFDCSAAGGCSPNRGEGLRAWELEVPARFFYLGWDFETVWGASAQFSAPCLPFEHDCARAAFPTLAMAGDGSATTPYQIESCAQLEAMNRDLGAAYTLVRDLDCGAFDMGDGHGFWPVGSAARPFTGSLSGAGHTITGLRIMRPEENQVALFGALDGATITQLTLENATVLGNGEVAILAGRSGGQSQYDACSIHGIVGARTTAAATVGMPTEDAGVSCAQDVTVTVLP